MSTSARRSSSSPPDRRRIAVGVVSALVGALVLNVAAGSATDVATGRQPVPALVLPRLDGSGRLSVVAFRGKVVVVNFWASWCAPCNEEAPLLQRTWARDRQRGLIVLGVDANDAAGDARRFARRHRLTYPLVRDARGSTLGHWGVYGLPFTFVVDRSGRIAGKIAGGLALHDNRPRLARLIARELKR
jgi:cytochrome c biogenesis protein CcmG, thiol:disulfide interchange protein DsbE